MTGPAKSERFITHPHRSAFLAGYLLIFGYGLRRFSLLDDPSSLTRAAILLALFTLLYATQGQLLRRFPGYLRVYFVLQIGLVQLLGLFQEYLDTWALLYVILGMRAMVLCSRREALAWASLFAGAILGTLSVQFGLLSGLGRAFAYIVIGIFVIAYDIQYARREDAQAGSQVLLEELQAAHQKLKDQAAQAERLAAAQERNRLAHEIHDAVGQKIFAIQLMTETACTLLEKDPGRAASQLDLLQEQTQAALSQMRQLISRWRTDSPVPRNETG